MLDAHNPVTPKPRLRGRLHQIAFVCAIPAGVVLVALGQTTTARTSSAVYAVGIIALYGVSASYHRIDWSDRARVLMRKLDHSTIFVFIAATYTPFSVLALRGVWRVSILATVWGIAAIGVGLKFVRLKLASRAGVAMYLAMGWTAVAAIPELVRALTVAEAGLLVAGGLLYTVGAIVYARRKPDPNPVVFGYHEVYHSFVIAASLCHYGAILSLVTSAG